MVEVIPWTLLFIAIAAQGLYLALLIGSGKKRNNYSFNYLSWFIVCFSLILLFWVGYWNGMAYRFIGFDAAFFPIPFLLGPLLYLYVHDQIEGSTNSILIHFVPAIGVSLFAFGMYLFLKTDTAEPYIITLIQEVVYSLHSVSYIVYTFLTYEVIKKERLLKQDEKNPIMLDRFKVIIFLFGVFAFLSLVNFILNRIIELPVFIDVLLALLISIVIYIIGYIGHYKQTPLLLLKKQTLKKYRSSSLKSELAPDLLNQLIFHIETNQSYLNSGYKLKDLARETDLPTQHISELLNKYHNSNFAALINTYRVQHARQMLLSNKYNHMKTAAIGYESGFNSSSTFYFWFKKLTGQSPKDFRKITQKTSE